MEIGILLVLLLTFAATKGSDYRTVYACEGGQLHIGCEEGFHIHLLRANFGRFSISICNEHGSLDWSVNCMAKRSYYVIHERCHLMSNCIVSASSDIFTDPCPGTYKYLEVQYQCKLEMITTSTSKSEITDVSSSTMRPSIIIPFTRPVRLTDATTLLPNYTHMKFQQNTSTTTPYSPIVILLSSPKPYVMKSSAKADLNFNKENYCQPIYSRNLLWNWTIAGSDFVQKCPGGTSGEARWHCAEDPVQWIPDTPDLSECSSLWVDNLKQRIKGDSVVNIAAELSVMTHRKPLYGGDIKNAAEILHSIVSKMDEKMKEIADDKQTHYLLQELLENASDVVSNLLDTSPPWNELGQRDKRNIASTILESLEMSGWLLASAQKSNFLYYKALNNLFIAVQVREIWSLSEVSFPITHNMNDSVWDQVEDYIHLPTHALLATASNGVVKMVFASYRHVKDFLGNVISTNDHNASQNTTGFINSKVISAYTGRYPGMKFSEPVTIEFKLIQEENVTNPQCVFWDLNMRFWSTEGCWLKKQNKTHAVCECNHLTHFALFMEENAQIVIYNNYFFQKIVIFISCGIAIAFSVLTVTILHIFQTSIMDHTLICKHFCICLLLVEVTYVASYDQSDIVCSILSGLLHFLLQALFLWLFLVMFHLYSLLINPAQKNKICHFSAIAYGVPALIVFVSGLVDFTSYGTENYCFLKYGNFYIFCFVGPAIICLIGTCLMSLMTLLKVCCFKDKNSTRKNIIKVQNQSYWFILLSVGITWTFFLLYLERKSEILTYLFAIFNCLQGVAILVFFGLQNYEVKKAYRTWKEGSSSESKGSRNHPLAGSSNLNIREMPYMPHSSTISSVSTVTTPEVEFPMGTFHHDLYHATRSPIYDNRERLVS